MKIKLLRRLRAIGREQITIYSVTTTTSLRGEFVTGMSYGYNDDAYKGLFTFGDTKEEIRDRAMRIYFEKNMEYIRYKYRTNIQNLNYRDIDSKQFFQKNVASLFFNILLFPYEVFECAKVA